MGLGKTLKIALTQQIKCDKCGAVIVDGSYNKDPNYITDNFGNLRLTNPGGSGVGIFNNLVYGAQKKTLCSACKFAESFKKDMEGIQAQQDQAIADAMELDREKMEMEKEKIELERELLRV